jgi:hypothetical protein
MIGKKKEAVANPMRNAAATTSFLVSADTTCMRRPLCWSQQSGGSTSCSSRRSLT